MLKSRVNVGMKILERRIKDACIGLKSNINLGLNPFLTAEGLFLRREATLSFGMRHLFGVLAEIELLCGFFM